MFFLTSGSSDEKSSEISLDFVTRLVGISLALVHICTKIDISDVINAT